MLAYEYIVGVELNKERKMRTTSLMSEVLMNVESWRDHDMTLQEKFEESWSQSTAPYEEQKEAFQALIQLKDMTLKDAPIYASEDNLIGDFARAIFKGSTPKLFELTTYEATYQKGVDFVKTNISCACGHICDKTVVMTTSFGTSCPDCYDRMEEGI